MTLQYDAQNYRVVIIGVQYEITTALEENAIIL